MRFKKLALAGLGTALISLGGCSSWPSLYADHASAPPPPPIRPVRLLQVPEDLRGVMPRTSPANSMPVPIAGPVLSERANPASLTADTLPAKPAAAVIPPYLPTTRESLAPTTWTVDPVHDFPWMAGAVPVRVNEETTVGVGNRMFGRLFAEVHFGSIPSAAVQLEPSTTPQPHPSSSPLTRWLKSWGTPTEKMAEPADTQPALLRAAEISCSGPTCLDFARDMLLIDAERKGWTTLVNRRVSLHQSFQFQRDDRVVWIELNSTGASVLQVEYAIVPSQTTSVRGK